MAENKKNEGLNLQPQALEAEEAVLGSMMIDEDAANKAISILGSSHYFYKDSHRKIFEAMISLINNNDPSGLNTQPSKNFKILHLAG